MAGRADQVLSRNPPRTDSVCMAGADGNDLIDIGRALTACPIPRSFRRTRPEPCAQAPVAVADGSGSPSAMPVGSASSKGALAERIPRCGATRRELPPDALVLVIQPGHHDVPACGAARPVAPGPVGYSGMFSGAAPPEAVEKEIVSRPPVLLIHGDSDELIPVQALFHASSSLQALDVPVKWHISREGSGTGPRGTAPRRRVSGTPNSASGHYIRRDKGGHCAPHAVRSSAAFTFSSRYPIH